MLVESMDNVVQPSSLLFDLLRIQKDLQKQQQILQKKQDEIQCTLSKLASGTHEDLQIKSLESDTDGYFSDHHLLSKDEWTLDDFVFPPPEVFPGTFTCSDVSDLLESPSEDLPSTQNFTIDVPILENSLLLEPLLEEDYLGTKAKDWNALNGQGTEDEGVDDFIHVKLPPNLDSTSLWSNHQALLPLEGSNSTSAISAASSSNSKNSPLPEELSSRCFPLDSQSIEHSSSLVGEKAGGEAYAQNMLSFSNMNKPFLEAATKEDCFFLPVLLSDSEGPIQKSQEAKAEVTNRLMPSKSSSPSSVAEGNDIAQKLAAIVRKRRKKECLEAAWEPCEPAREALVSPDAETKSNDTLITSHAPFFPRFSIAKEAILRSLGVDTSNCSKTAWIPSLDPGMNEEQKNNELVARAPLPPHLTRNTVLALAEAISTADQPRAHMLSMVLSEESSPSGSPSQRLAHTFMKALNARRENAAEGKYSESISFNPQEECAVWEFVRSLPCLQFWMEGIAGTILEAVSPHEAIHIVDFGIWAGQWKTVLRQLAKRHGGAPRVTLTAVYAPPGTPNGLGPVVKPLYFEKPILETAAACGLQLELRSLTCKMEDFRAAMVGVKEGEVVAVNTAIRLAQLVDASVVRWSPRDAFLRELKELHPVVVTTAGMSMDSNGFFFLPRVQDSYDAYSLIFETNERLSTSASPGREIFEQQIMYREIVNLVGCEGVGRVVRHERLPKWKARMWTSGFVGRPQSESLISFLRDSAQSRCPGLDVKASCEGGAELTYRGHSMGHLGAWMPVSKFLTF